jgi:uncharacterized protein (DUF849 family)
MPSRPGRAWQDNPPVTDPDRSRPHVPHPLRPYEPLIVNAAINGMVPRRSEVPHLPVTAEQIVADAVACVDAGAAILHLHARNADESPAWERDAYRAFIPAIREQRPEAVICVSTSGRDVAELERRADVLELDGDARPDMASLTLGSLNLRTGASVNAPETIVGLAERMSERGVRPELEVFDSGHLVMVKDLIRDGLIDAPALIQLCMGIPYGAPPDPLGFMALVNQLPPGAVFSAFSIGRMQLPYVALAAIAGGNARVGLEDNLYLARGKLATNADLVARAVTILEAMNVRVLGPAEVRERLGLVRHG